MARQRSNISNVNPADIDIDGITRRLEANINKINNYKKRNDPSIVGGRRPTTSNDSNNSNVASAPNVPPSVANDGGVASNTSGMPNAVPPSATRADPLGDLREAYTQIKERERARAVEREKKREEELNREGPRGRERDSGVGRESYGGVAGRRGEDGRLMPRSMVSRRREDDGFAPRSSAVDGRREDDGFAPRSSAMDGRRGEDGRLMPRSVADRIIREDGGDIPRNVMADRIVREDVGVVPRTVVADRVVREDDGVTPRAVVADRVIREDDRFVVAREREGEKVVVKNIIERGRDEEKTKASGVDGETISELKRNYETLKSREDGIDRMLSKQQDTLSALQRDLENVKNHDINSFNKEISDLKAMGKEIEKEKFAEIKNQTLSDMREKDLANQINSLKTTISRTENDRVSTDISNIKDLILSSSENKAVYLQKIVTTLENDRYNNIQVELAKLSTKLDNDKYSGLHGLGGFNGFGHLNNSFSSQQISALEGEVAREMDSVKGKIRDIEKQSSQGDSDLKNYLMSLERKFDSVLDDIKKLKEENKHSGSSPSNSSLPSQVSVLESDVIKGMDSVKDKIHNIEKQSSQGENDLKNYLMSLERKFDSMLDDIKKLKEENKHTGSSSFNSSNNDSPSQISVLESSVMKGMQDVKDRMRDMEIQSTQGDNDLKNYLMSLERKFDSMNEDIKKLKEESNQYMNEHKVNTRLDNIRNYLQERPKRNGQAEPEQKIQETITEEKETIEVKEVKKDDFFDFLNIDEDKKKKSDIMLMANKETKLQSEISDSPSYKNFKKKKINMLDEIYNICLNEAKLVPEEVKKLNPKTQDANLQTIANSRFLKASYGKILTLFNKNVSPDTLFADLAENPTRVIDAKYINESAKKVSLVASVRRINIRDIKNASCIILCRAGRNYTILGDGKYYDPYQNTVKDFKVEEFVDQYFGYAIFFNETILSVSSFLKKTSQIFDTIKEHKALFIEMVAISFIINIFALASPFFTTNVYDRVIPNNATDTMIVLATGMLLVYVFDFIFKSVKSYISEYISSNIGVNIDRKLMAQLLKEKAPGINLTSALKINVFKEISTIREFYFSKFIPSMIEVPFVFLFILVLFMISPLMALIPFVAGILIIVTNIMMQVPMQKSHSIMMQNDHRRNSVLTETMLSSSAVKVFNGVGKRLSMWSRVLDTYYLSSFKHNLWINVAAFASIMIMSAASLFVLIIGVYETRVGNITVGGIIAANILVSRILSPLVSFAGLIVRYRNIQQIMSSVQKVFSEPQEDESDNNTAMKGPFAGGVSFKNVTFFYPQQKIPVLNKVSFDIKPREKVAIIGKTGAGKSTIVKLITKLDIPNSGRVMIDEFDVDAIYSTELRFSIGYLPQQSYFFQGTLRDNILLSDKTVSDEDYDKACTLAGVHEITSLYSKGDDMLIQEGGSNLSGGQKQIVALARAIINQPPIIIMDEPTNGMDNSLESAFMKNVLNYTKDKTFILITHKISQLSLVERVILLDKGAVLLDGKTEEVVDIISKVTE